MNAVPLGTVHHLAIAVKDPDASARWWSASFDLKELRRAEGRVVLANDSVLLVLIAGEPGPAALRHLAFQIPDMETLRAAVELLGANNVAVEDPGNEIGPTSPGSSDMGIWFRDLDGYRWELFVAAPPAA